MGYEMTIRSKVPSEQYKENYDSIFRKTPTPEPVRDVSQTDPQPDMLEVPRGQ